MLFRVFRGRKRKTAGSRTHMNRDVLNHEKHEKHEKVPLNGCRTFLCATARNGKNKHGSLLDRHFFRRHYGFDLLVSVLGFRHEKVGGLTFLLASFV